MWVPRFPQERALSLAQKFEQHARYEIISHNITYTKIVGRWPDAGMAGLGGLLSGAGLLDGLTPYLVVA